MKKALAFLTIAIIVFQGFALLATTVNAQEVSHDIEVIDVATNTPHEYPRRIVNITVVVENNGNVSETFNVTAYGNSTEIETKLVTGLGVGENTTLVFNWNTSGLTPGQNWTIEAKAPLDGDLTPLNNNMTDGTVFIKMLGDVNVDRTIDIDDIAEVATIFGGTPSSVPDWNPQADLYPDGLIDIFDLVTISMVFKAKY